MPNTDYIPTDMLTGEEQTIELSNFRQRSSGHSIEFSQRVAAVSIPKRATTVDGLAFKLRGRRGFHNNPDWSFLRSRF